MRPATRLKRSASAVCGYFALALSRLDIAAI